jgi:hypothetical protein
LKEIIYLRRPINSYIERRRTLTRRSRGAGSGASRKCGSNATTLVAAVHRRRDVDELIEK